MTDTSVAPKTFAEAEAVLAQALPGYESRPQQQVLARNVESVLAEGGLGLFEAGCGTGKSLGAMIPAILSGKRTVVATATIALMEQYCLAPETRVLTSDLRYVPISDVKEGDDLVGFDEERIGNRRRFRTSTVLSSERIMRPSYRITFADGTSMVASEDHRWLARRGPEVKWITTKSLAPETNRRRGSNIVRLFDTWETGTSYAHGYLAAAFDGEGHLTQKRSTQVPGGVVNRMGFAQRNNEMLAEVEPMLASLGFKASVRDRGDIWSVGISDREQIVHLLGEVRPKRLLAHFSVDMLGTIPTYDGARVVAKEYLGEVEVVAVQTSTGTFVAEGLASHNCNKDVPFLQEHLGKPFTWALLKGRSNYYCEAKAAQISDRSAVPHLDAMQAELAANPDHSGDREHFATPVEKAEFSLVSSTSAECPGRRECPFGDVCYAERAKALAQDANVVVTNTAMLLTDVKVREVTNGNASMLGSYDALIIDEAHELEEQATSAFTDEIRANGIKKFVTEARNFLVNQGADFGIGDDVLSGVEGLWAILPDEGRLDTNWLFEHAETFLDLMDSISAVRNVLAETKIRVDGKKAEARQATLVRRAENYITTLASAVDPDAEDLVRYIEVDTFQGANGRQQSVKKVMLSPVNVGPLLRKNLWDLRPSVLVSATLSVGGRFDYIIDRLGAEGAKTINVGTPFDYSKQATLFIPASNMPNPSRDRNAWLTYASIATTELVRASGGGALLLFTSRTAMNQAHQNMRSSFEDMGLTVLIQGQGSNKALAKTFTEDTHSVLFALKSFFTGVDFAGETCRLVVIDKLAFQVPTDPMVQARGEQVERNGKSSFFDLAIPAMTLTMVQGFGRLIRSKNDKGVVAILDSRLSSSGWGKRIVKTMPPAPVTTDLDDVRSFFAAV